MASYVLTETGEVVVRKSVWALSTEEQETDEVKTAKVQLDRDIAGKIRNSLPANDIPPELRAQQPEVPDTLFTDDQDDENVEPFEPEATKAEADDTTPEAYDEYLTAEVMMPHGGDMLKAIVKGRKRDSDGLPIGCRNNNPLLDSRQYEVEFPDGSTEAFTANFIAQNMLSQVDAEGRS